MSEPLALKVLKLPSLLFKTLAKTYTAVVFFPAVLIFRIFEKVLFTNDQIQRQFKIGMLANTIIRDTLSILITVLYLWGSTISIQMCYLWIKGVNNVPFLKKYLEKTLKIQSEGTMGKLLYADGASINLASKIIIYSLCVVQAYALIKQNNKKFGTHNFLDKKVNKMILVFVYAIHAILDLLTLVLYIPTIPFRSFLQDEDYTKRQEFIGHWLIGSNLSNFVYLLPRCLAMILLPILKTINIRENTNINIWTIREDSHKIIGLSIITVIDLMFLLNLRIAHFILSRNNFVQNWRVFRSKVMMQRFIDRLGCYIETWLVALFYLKKHDYLIEYNLAGYIKERDILPKALVESISYPIAQMVTKVMILANWRRAAAVNIARDKVISIKAKNGIRMFNSIEEYVVDYHIKNATEQTNTQLLDFKMQVDKKTLDLIDQLETTLTVSNRFSEAMKLYKKINQSKLSFSTQRKLLDDTVWAQDLKKDLEFFHMFFWSDIISNWLAAIACVINPIRGFISVLNLARIDYTKIESINEFNKQVSKIYPLIFFDFIVIAFFLILVPFNYVFGNHKPMTVIIKRVFLNDKSDPRLKKLNDEKFLFFMDKIFFLTGMALFLIISSIKYYLLLPFAVFSPEEFKEYKLFIYTCQFNGLQNQLYAFSTFYSLFWAKFAMLKRRAPAQEKQTLKDLIEMTKVKVWHEKCIENWYNAVYLVETQKAPIVLEADPVEVNIQDNTNIPLPPVQEEVPIQLRIRRCRRCTDRLGYFFRLIIRILTRPFVVFFKSIKKLKQASGERKLENIKKRAEKIRILKEKLSLKYDQNSPDFAFVRKSLDDIYKVQYMSISSYAKMLKYEKWLKKLVAKKPEDANEILPERPQLKTQNGVIMTENTELYLKYLIPRQKKIIDNYSQLKLYMANIILKITSLTLLWRILDMKTYFNEHLIAGLFAEPKQNEKAKPHVISVYLQIYKICFKNLIVDIAYWWSFVLMLRIDKGLWTVCNRKIEQAQYKTVNNNTDEPMTEFRLTTLEEVLLYDKEKRMLIFRYSGYSLNERLESILFILGKVFFNRTEMIQKISNLKRIPQYQNINNKRANILIITILGYDLILYLTIGLSFLFNPLRMASFFFYVKSGDFSNSINPVIHFDRFQSYNLIKKDALDRIHRLTLNSLKCIKQDVLLILKIMLLFVFPIRLIQLSKIYLNIKLKLRRKKNREDNTFCDIDFATKMNEYLNEVLGELKKDASSAFAIFIILIGVFHVKSSWLRVKHLIVYQAKQTVQYHWLRNFSRRSFSGHMEAIGILGLLIKLGLYKKKVVATDINKGSRVLFKEVGWSNLIELGDYLTVQDKLVLCTVNKNTRDYFSRNSVIWLNFYKKNINPDVTQFESFSTISFECIALARKIEAEKNFSKERDFRLGFRYILKEQAIRSIISLPDLVSTPYKMVALGIEKAGVQFVKPQNVVSTHREQAEEVANLRNIGRPQQRQIMAGRGVLKCYPKYAVTFRQNFNTISGTVSDEAVEIDRVRGFLYLEILFYKLILAIGTVNAIARRPFFWSLYGGNVPSYTERVNFFTATFNSFKASLQIIYCLLVLFLLWKYLMVLIYKFNFDVLSAIAGPFLLHPFIGYHLINEVRIMDPYRGADFNIDNILRCYVLWIGCVADYSFLPFVRGIKKVFTYIFKYGIIGSVKGIFDCFKIIVETYELTLVYPTKLLVKKGIFLELLHLIYTMIWILWPQAFIWGYVSLGINLQISWSLKPLWDNAVVNNVRELTWRFTGSYIAAAWGFLVCEFWGVWEFFTTHFLIVQFINVLDWIKRIWVIGHLIRLVIWLVGKVFGWTLALLLSGFGLRIVLGWVLGYLFTASETLLAKDGGSTQGSILPKILLSVFILSSKIGWAVKIMYKNDKKVIN